MDREDFVEHVEWLLSEGDAEKASLLCRRGLRRFPRDHQLWFLLGDSLMETGRLAQADRAFRTASDIQGDWAPPVAKRAEVLLMMGKTGQARLLSTAAYEMDRDSGLTSYIKAMVFDVDNRPDAALFFYLRAHRLDPEHFFPPLVLSSEAFDSVARAVIDDIRQTPFGRAHILETKWEFLDRVPMATAGFRGVSPLTECHMAVERKKASASTTQKTTSQRPTQVAKGYLFRTNIFRFCEAESDLQSQIHIAISNSLDDLGSQLAWLDEFELGV